MSDRLSKLKISNISKDKNSSRSNLSGVSRTTSIPKNLGNNFHKVEDQIAHYILNLRQTKISLLQKYNNLFSARNALEERIRSIQERQFRKATQDKQSQQLLYLSELKKKEVLTLSLSDLQHSSHKTLQKVSSTKKSQFQILYDSEQTDSLNKYSVAEQILKLRSDNYRFAEQLNNLLIKHQINESEINQANQQHARLKQRVDKLREERDLMRTSSFQSQQIKYQNQAQQSTKKQQIIAALQRQNAQNEAQIQQIYPKIQFPDKTISDLQNYINEEDEQKQNLFIDLQQYKEDQRRLKRQNELMNQFINLFYSRQST